jgi:hypothetical protein
MLGGFYIIIHKDAGSAYGITFPDDETAFAASDTFEGIESAALEVAEMIGFERFCIDDPYMIGNNDGLIDWVPLDK